MIFTILIIVLTITIITIIIQFGGKNKKKVSAPWGPTSNASFVPGKFGCC